MRQKRFGNQSFDRQKREWEKASFMMFDSTRTPYATAPKPKATRYASKPALVMPLPVFDGGELFKPSETPQSLAKRLAEGIAALVGFIFVLGLLG